MSAPEQAASPPPAPAPAPVPEPSNANPNPDPEPVPAPVVSDIAPPSTAVPSTHGPNNGFSVPTAAPPAPGPEQQQPVQRSLSNAGIGSRSATPHSHSQPSTPTVNSVPPTLPVPSNGNGNGQGHEIAAGNGHGNGHTLPPLSSKGLRWRNPVTVKYEDGQVQPGRVVIGAHGEVVIDAHGEVVIGAHGEASPVHATLPPLSQLPQPPAHHHSIPQGPPPSAQPPPAAPSPHQYSQPPLHHQPYPTPRLPAPAPAPSQQPAPSHAYAPQPRIKQQQHIYLSHSQPPPPPPPPPPQSTSRQTTKPVIMDPPGRRQSLPVPSSPVAPPASPAAGFPSPSRDYAAENPKFVDDCTRISFAVQQSLPEAVRRTVRDNWEKCLLGSDFHQAFILNAAIHHSVPSITRRAVRDFGAKMVHDCKDELVKHFTTRDIDEIGDLIISIASDKFLDKCLEKRLPSIEAKPLINALARAERLGYEKSDIVEEDHHERVNPHAPAPAAPVEQPPQGYPAPSQPRPQPRWQCLDCFRTFVYESAYQYHTSKRVCSRPPPTPEGYRYMCEHCGQGFTTQGGQHYHKVKAVCGDFANQVVSQTPVLQPPPPPRAQQPPQSYQPHQPHPSPSHPQQFSPPPPPPRRGPGRPPRNSLPQQTYSPVAPATPNGQPAFATPGSTPASASPRPARSLAQAASAAAAQTTGIQADPYGHLTPEQLAAMNTELQEAEARYKPRFKEAERIPDPEERRTRIDGLRNSFGTKQSMIRKKYGVRLRERRTRAVIEAERARMGITRAEKSLEAPSAGTAAPEMAAWGGVHAAAQQQQQEAARREALPPPPPAPAPPPSAAGSGWVAANTVKRSTPPTTDAEPSAKRAKTEAEVAGANGMGGFHSHGLPKGDGNNMQASTTPTTGGFPTGAQAPEAGPARDGQQPHDRAAPRAEDTPETMSGTSGVNTPQESASSSFPAPGQGKNPVQHPPPAVVDGDSASSDDDDEDIPASLPAHVIHSLEKR